MGGALWPENEQISRCRDQALSIKGGYEAWVQSLRMTGKQHRGSTKRFYRYSHRVRVDAILLRKPSKEQTGELANVLPIINSLSKRDHHCHWLQ